MVHFVGAGTGAPDLITVRGQKLLREADVVIYAGSLINKDLLKECGSKTELHDSAKLTLEEMVDIIREADAKNLDIVRLSSGDPAIYGAIKELSDELCKLHIPHDFTPGVTACASAAASLGLEYTLPGVTQTLIITRLPGKCPVPEAENIKTLVSTGASVAVYLSAGMTGELVAKLKGAGLDPKETVAMVYKASWDDEKRIVCALDELVSRATEEGIDSTAVILFGGAVKLLAKDDRDAGKPDAGQPGEAGCGYERSRLYDPEFETGYRGRRI